MLKYLWAPSFCLPHNIFTYAFIYPSVRQPIFVFIPNPSVWLPTQSSNICAPTCLSTYLFIHPSYTYLSIYPTKSLTCPPPIHLSYQSSILISLYPFIHSTIHSSTNRSGIIFFILSCSALLCFTDISFFHASSSLSNHPSNHSSVVVTCRL